MEENEGGKRYKINLDPRILELLGLGLYTNIYYILAELIANAYDANAKNVYILQKDDRLIVEDDGNGMSYTDGDIGVYLNVAAETRTGKHDEYVKGSDKKRKRMGRKGVGKLAALSVSEDVKIMTVRDGEKSGFILSRIVSDDHLLKPVLESEIKFEKISGNGTSISMMQPQYKLHKTIKAVRNNILKIFPLVDSDFKIHVKSERGETTIDSFEKEIISGLGGLIILGDEYNHLFRYFDSQLSDKELERKELKVVLPAYKKVMELKCRSGQVQEFTLSILGWIGVYRTTSGKKADVSDFPDNFISLLSNKKLGEYNILPMIGKNYLNEVYVVGQLHVDLFEESVLPDIALSNRQGYKSDDDRYQAVIKYIREELLPKVLSLRVKYANSVKDEKNKEKDRLNIEREGDLREKIDEFKNQASSTAAAAISDSLKESEGGDADYLVDAIKEAINVHLPDMGIKKKIDAAKKKLLISHASKDKSVCDFIYGLLVFSGIPEEDIIYTSSENEQSRVPQKMPIFDYLREFFVESYSTEKILVFYVTSDDMVQSWPAVSEVGAGWITKSTHDIVNINTHEPRKPLDIDCEWANVKKDSNGIVSLSQIEADKIAIKIIYACEQLGYSSKPKDLVIQEIKRTANIES